MKRRACCCTLAFLFLIGPQLVSAGPLQIYDKRALQAEAKHDYATALANFTACVEQFPESSAARYNRAMFYYRRHQYQLALEDIDSAIRLKPRYLLFGVTRASVYGALGNYSRALQEYNYLLTLTSPKGASAGPSGIPHLRAMILNGRAWIQATCPDGRYRNGQQALIDAKKALAIGGEFKNSYLDTLAAAYAETGDFDSAVRCEQEALANQPKDDPLRDPTGPINAYRQHRPYRSKS